MEPPMISVAMRPIRHTHKGIRQNLTFSVNVPSVDLVKETDYCGIASGAKVNKVAACQFSVFYGKLGTAPLISQCPVNLECKVVHSLELDTHTLFIGQVEETHISENCLTNGKPDVGKIQPFIYNRPTQQYQAFGEIIARSHRIGLEITARK
jgi:flavin reductase (DIM6/NTAB) family NADH-FMN oxidoreductase RutF